MKETCINCGKWRGLHKWDTMQCPFDEKESGLFLVNQFYAEENAELAALRAERDELREALEQTLETLRLYSYHEYLDAPARAVLAKYAGKEE